MAIFSNNLGGSPVLKMAGRNRKNAEILQKSNEEGKKLVSLAQAGNLEGVKRLVESGASVNAEEYNRFLFYRSQNYMTPLQCAALHGHSDLVQFSETERPCQP